MSEEKGQDAKLKAGKVFLGLAFVVWTLSRVQPVVEKFLGPNASDLKRAEFEANALIYGTVPLGVIGFILFKMGQKGNKKT